MAKQPRRPREGVGCQPAPPRGLLGGEDLRYERRSLRRAGGHQAIRLTDRREGDHQRDGHEHKRYNDFEHCLLLVFSETVKPIQTPHLLGISRGLTALKSGGNLLQSANYSLGLIRSRQESGFVPKALARIFHEACYCERR